jgi:predicted RNase H-like HicB family nuclease
MAVADKSEIQVEELLARPYRKVIWGDREEGFMAEAPELEGCMTAGESEEEALALLRDAMAGWFESRLAHGQSIPEPTMAADAQYSGKILLRTSPRLHRLLAELAHVQGVSLNQWVTTVLAMSVGEHVGSDASKRRPV